MKVLSNNTKFAHLGKPGSLFSKGFYRRLNIITRLADLNDKKILDLGCGVGVWDEQFRRFTNAGNVYGSDIDRDSIEKLKVNYPKLKPENFKVCPAESLKFPGNFFDIVFSNEVLEHVKDDVQAVAECLRVLRPGGKFIFFTPNRAWPFETHGMFLFGKYIWGNIPLLPWAPKFIYKKYVPHVRNYSNNDIRNIITESNKLSRGHNFKIIYHSHVFPGFDKFESKYSFLGKFVRKMFHYIETTPLHFFGISHLVIAEKQVFTDN